MDGYDIGDPTSDKLFTAVEAQHSGLTFSNDLEITAALNPYTYRNFYNGGGVAVGDIDNDGNLDLYFSGNQVDNRLYINKGSLRFEEVTDEAGVDCKDVWSTGVAMVDVDADGWLDIYVCKAGPPEGPNRHNELFINKGDGTFSEMSKQYGLDITSMSVQSAWLDYDRDGDLDMYLLSNSIRAVGGFDFTKGLRNQYSADGNKLFRNDGDSFTDVTTTAGIYSNSINYGLDVAIEDFNVDGWPDIFVSNDFFERDYLYLNNQDGTFTERATDAFSAMSMGSMGVDVGDINHDQIPDLFVTEMLPATIQRRKTKAQFEVWDKYQLAVRNGYHHQFARNMLHLSAGDMQYYDIGRMAGTDATEWSWSALLEDFNHDGHLDLHITNGIGKDLLDKDYLNYIANESFVAGLLDTSGSEVFLDLVEQMPQSPVPNKLYINDGELGFSDEAATNDMAAPSYSSGSVAADLDNDGDLDIVVSNIDETASLYRNDAAADSIKAWLLVDLRYPAGQYAIGAVATAYVAGKAYRQMLTCSAGFQSSMVGPLHFGLGQVDQVDSLHIFWPDGTCETRYSLAVNQRQLYTQGTNTLCSHDIEIAQAPSHHQLDYSHKEPTTSQFVRERLISHMHGFRGPALLDMGEGLLYVGGGKHQSSAIIESSTGRVVQELSASTSSETTDAVLVDIDADGDPDIYEAHGGKMFSPGSSDLDDIIWVNDGGTFQKKEITWPDRISTSSITVADIDGDGNPEVLVAEGQRVRHYGQPGSLYMVDYVDGVFAVSLIARDLGMITDLVVTPPTTEQETTLLAVGHWMPITVLTYNDGIWSQRSIEGSTGLWNTIEPLQVGKRIFYLLGNQGLNSVYTPGTRLHVADLDGNGSAEQILSKAEGGQRYSIQDLDELYTQLPVLRKRFATYDAASRATLEELFGDAISDATTTELDVTASAVLSWESIDGALQALPKSMQQSTINAFLPVVHADGVSIVAGGNHYRAKPQFGRDDASYGWHVEAKIYEDSLIFDEVKSLGIKGQVREIVRSDDQLYFGMNNDKIVVLDVPKK